VNQESDNGATLLFIAAQKGRLEVVQALLGAGSSVDAAEENGATPLFIAAQRPPQGGASAGGRGCKRGRGKG